jgi:hypothetical protein
VREARSAQSAYSLGIDNANTSAVGQKRREGLTSAVCGKDIAELDYGLRFLLFVCGCIIWAFGIIPLLRDRAPTWLTVVLSVIFGIVLARLSFNY